MLRELTCIVCPIGCNLKVEIENGEVVSVSGNTCKRGEEYAKAECTNPIRTVTSTMMTEIGIPVPVKTDRQIPKDKIFECMKIINNKIVSLPVFVGDVIIEDVFGANIIATGNMQEDKKDA